MIAIALLMLGAFGVVPWLTVALITPTVYFVDTGLLWVLYLGVMNLDRVDDAGRTHPGVIPRAKIVLIFGLAVDLLYNWSWAILVFRDLPREALVTSRLKRYKYGIWPATGWRLERANWYCDVMLDPYDPHPSGKHVRP